MRAHLEWAEETLAELNKIAGKRSRHAEPAGRRDVHANEILAPATPDVRQRPPQLASWKHLAGFLLIGAGIVALGVLAQHSPAGGGVGGTPGQLGRHSQAIPIYLVAIAMDWALLYYCWAGVHHRGGELATLAGGPWTSWKSVAVDAGIALAFWVLWEGAEYGIYWLLGPSRAKSVDSLLPRSLLEILLWIQLRLPLARARKWHFGVICSGSFMR